MSRRILIIPDKFKGTLTARQAAYAIAAGWRSVHPNDVLHCIPMSDGGDGFGSVLAGALEATRQTTATIDSAGRSRSSDWWVSPSRSIAVVETAQTIGLALLPHGQFHPFQLDSFGIGAVLRDAVASGARDCWVGIGGSSTNDAGFGLARSLGWQFLDSDGNEILRWRELTRLVRVIRSKEPLQATCRFTVAVDVENPLLGPTGCSRVYGPQKGLRPEDMIQAEAALEQLAKVMAKELGRDIAVIPGSGAAGGLGFALMAFLDARVESGFEIFARAADLDRHVDWSDLVLTGEGSLDRQSLMGKGTGRVAARARQHGRPCYGLAGMVEPLGPGETSLFTLTRGIVPALAPVEAAKADAARWLEELARQIAQASFRH
jgi:glycerate kinase